MRAMAVDYGDKRSGVAVSDATRSITGACFVVGEADAGRLAEKLRAEYTGRGADTLVLGHPLNMNGTAGLRAEKTAKLKTLLERRGVRVVLWDERRTTVEAEGILTGARTFGKKRRGTLDAVAASLILESFLLFEKNLPQPDQGGQNAETVP